MIIIALSGKKRSGKNTVSKLIETLTRQSVVEMAFADALKKEVAKACGVTVSYIEQHKDNFRLILQGWGTDFKRGLVKDSYWTDAIEKELVKVNADIVVITDVRFKNEYNYLNKLGAVLVRVSRPTTNDDKHPSETSLDDIKQWHFIVLNNGTIDDLVPQVKELLTKLNIPLKD